MNAATLPPSPPLHIAMLHNRYQYAGGEDLCLQADIALLRQFGHRVTVLETHNDRIKTYSTPEKVGLLFTTAWNRPASRQYQRELLSLQPDLVHVHNFFPLISPAIHAAARSLGIPTIQHLHNYRLGCLNPYLLRDNQICEACVGRNPWRGVVHRCYRRSLPASLSVWGMVTFNRWRGTWERDVSRFITPSQFAAEKLQQMGVPRDRLDIRPNVIVDPGSEPLPLPQQPLFVFAGRLSPEKGVLALLQAWAALNAADWQLKIIGDGPQRPLLEAFVQQHRLANVSFLGHLSATATIQMLQAASAVVIPSQWHETFGRTAIEAFACSRTVLASQLGALPELIQPGKTGFLLPPDQPQAWVDCLRWCGTHADALTTMGLTARQVYEQQFRPTAIYRQMMEIYYDVLALDSRQPC